MHSTIKRKMVAFALFALVGVAMAQVSPWTVKPFNPVSMTATGQTSAVVPMLSPGTSTGNSFASGSITVSGTGLVTATFAVMGSTDYGVNYFPLPLSPIATPGTTALTQTVTASGGIFQVNLATITNVKFVTSGTFTATSLQLLLTASPNGLVARQGGGGGAGGAAFPPSAGVVCNTSTTASTNCSGGQLAAAIGATAVAQAVSATTAIALGALPTLCPTGQAPTGVTASGNATGCAPITGSSGLADPGANGIVKRTSAGVTAPAVLGTDYYGPDAVNNGQAAYQAGSGGDATCHAPAAGMDLWCYFTAANAVMRSVNGGAYALVPTASASIANITLTLPTSAIAANECFPLKASAATATTMTGLTTTSAFDTAFGSDAASVDGWGATGGLTWVAYPTANTVNWRVCNQTTASITPGAMTLNVGAK